MTIKIPESKRYASDNPWLTFEGSEPATVRAKILAAFNMEADDSLSLFDVVLNAQRVATRQGEVQNTLGGTTIKVEPASSGSASAAEAAAPAEPEGPHPLFAMVESQTDVASLQRLWAENKAAFDADSTLMDAYKARGKAIMSGSA